MKTIELPLPLLLLDCLPQFRLQIPDSGLAHFVLRHVVESHVSQKCMVLFGLVQKPLQLHVSSLDIGLLMLINLLLQ